MRVFESGNLSDCFDCGEKSTHYIFKASLLKSSKRCYCKKCWLKQNKIYEDNKRSKK